MKFFAMLAAPLLALAAPVLLPAVGSFLGLGGAAAGASAAAGGAAAGAGAAASSGLSIGSILGTVGKVLPAVSGLLGGLGTMAQARQQQTYNELELQQLRLQGRAEEADAATRAADRMRRVREVLAANLARSGSLGLAGGGSLERLGEVALEDAERELDIDRLNTGTALMQNRLRQAQVRTRRPMAVGRAQAATQLAGGLGRTIQYW